MRVKLLANNQAEASNIVKEVLGYYEPGSVVNYREVKSAFVDKHDHFTVAIGNRMKIGSVINVATGESAIGLCRDAFCYRIRPEDGRYSIFKVWGHMGATTDDARVLRACVENPTGVLVINDRAFGGEKRIPLNRVTRRKIENAVEKELVRIDITGNVTLTGRGRIHLDPDAIPMVFSVPLDKMGEVNEAMNHAYDRHYFRPEQSNAGH